MLFNTLPTPEQPAQYILQTASQALSTHNPQSFEHILAKLIFLSGHISLKILLTIDGLENTLNKMKSEKEKASGGN